MTTNHAPIDSPAGRLHTAYTEAFRDGLAALDAIRLLRADLAELEDHAALNARRNGDSWQAIADAVGVSRQRAHQRWGAITAWIGWEDTAPDPMPHPRAGQLHSEPQTSE